MGEHMENKTMKKNLTSSPTAGAPAATGAAAAIANGTAKPDTVYSDWDTCIILAGAMRKVMSGAIDCINDTFALCDMMTTITECMATAPAEYLKDENIRTTNESEERRSLREHLPTLDKLPDDVVFRAADRLIAAGALKYRAAALAIFAAFHLEAAEVLELAAEASAVTEHNAKEA